jgi:hypothetical protein
MNSVNIALQHHFHFVIFKVPFILILYLQINFVTNTCFLNFLQFGKNSVGGPPLDPCVPKVARM